MDSKADSANLILKLYELRRDPTMRDARTWFIRFNPESSQDIVNALMGENSAYYRMVTSYWEMAASLVNHGAIDADMFNDANGEHVVVFAKVEPYLAELRQMFNSPQSLAHLEKVVMGMPDAAERIVSVRERIKSFTQSQSQSSGK